MGIDVMIVDTGADLNVYLETGEDGEKKGGCCAPAGAPAGGCGASAEATGAGCCGSVPKGVVSDSKRDLNEFAGK
jgi:hypothetical protein